MTPADLILLRHGRTEWNAAGRFQGQLDSQLDEVGREQVRAVAEVLAKRGIGRLVTSDQMRALHTAHEVGHRTGVDVHVDPRLREIDLGHWSGLTRDEVAVRFPEEYASWAAGEDLARGGGETPEQVGDRALAVITEHLELLEPGAGALVAVTHGFTARTVMLRLLGLPRSARYAFDVLGNCRWVLLGRTDGGIWRIREYNAGT